MASDHVIFLKGKSLIPIKAAADFCRGTGKSCDVFTFASK